MLPTEVLVERAVLVGEVGRCEADRARGVGHINFIVQEGNRVRMEVDAAFMCLHTESNLT